jgi:hypothetical protein
MTDTPDDTEHGGPAPIFPMKAAIEKFKPVVDTSRRARKARHKIVSESTDGRSLRATGRTEHLNFKATPQIKALLATHVPKGKVSLWLEQAIIEKLKSEGVEIDA